MASFLDSSRLVTKVLTPQEWDNLIGAKEGGRLSWSMTFFPAVHCKNKRSFYSNNLFMIYFRTLRQPVLPRWFQTLNPTSPPQVPTRRRRLSKNLPTLNPMNQLQALTRKKRQSKDLLTPNRTLPPQARTKKRLLSKSHLMGISGMRRKPKGSLLSE